MDETTTDVVPIESGEQIAPQSEPSPTGAVQDSPGGEFTIEALSQEVKQLTGMVRAFQSDEDRRIPTIERELKAQSEQLESYHKRRASGMTEQEAQRAEVLDQIVSERISAAPGNMTVSQESVPAEQAAVTVGAYLSPILKLGGLDANDADVIDIIRNERDPSKQMIAVANLAEAKKQVTPANPAAVMASGGGKAVEGDTLESITKELNELYTMPATPATRKRIQELGKQQKEFIPKQ